MNNKCKIILMLLIVIIAISSYFIFKEILESKKENNIFEDLKEIVQIQENLVTEDEIVKNESNNVTYKDETKQQYDLESIVKINSDVVGWLKIIGTNIDYPIMQNENYYLENNIYKQYSCHGTPYLAQYCNLKTSDNLIIYGHHMNDNTMFSQLDYYKNYNFYNNHKYIKFYTFENGETIEKNYQVASVFKTIAYSNSSFKYYNYTDFNSKEEIEEFIENCSKLALYDTGIKINYGDKLLTLSTCEYSQKNGRIVIVAKEI